MKFALIISVLFLLAFPLVSAQYSDCSIYGTCQKNTASSFPSNTSTLNVNNSQYLEGHPASYFYPYSNPLNFINESNGINGSDYILKNGSTTTTARIPFAEGISIPSAKSIDLVGQTFNLGTTPSSIINVYDESDGSLLGNIYYESSLFSSAGLKFNISTIFGETLLGEDFITVGDSGYLGFGSSNDFITDYSAGILSLDCSSGLGVSCNTLALNIGNADMDVKADTVSVDNAVEINAGENRGYFRIPLNTSNITSSGQICDSNGCIGSGGADGTGGWTNTSTETNTSLIVNVNSASIAVAQPMQRWYAGSTLLSQMRRDGAQNWYLYNATGGSTGSIVFATPGGNPGINIYRNSSLTDYVTYANLLTGGFLIGSNGVTHISSTTDGNVSIPAGRLTAQNELRVGTDAPSVASSLAITRDMSGAGFQMGFVVDNTIESSNSGAYGMYMIPLLDPANNQNAVAMYSGGTVVADTGETVTNAWAGYDDNIVKSGTGTITNAYGRQIDAPTVGVNNWGLWLNGNGFGGDLVLGTGKNSRLYYNATTFGRAQFNGALQANDYYSADNTIGWTGTCPSTNSTVVKNGLVVGCV